MLIQHQRLSGGAPPFPGTGPARRWVRFNPAEGGSPYPGAYTQASGTAEREAALHLVDTLDANHRITLGADKGYDSADFVEELRARNVTPHIAQNTSRRSAVDGRVTRHAGYEQSQRKRKLVEEIFGWTKTVGNLRKLHFRGIELVSESVRWSAIAFNLIRIRNLGAAT